MTTLVRGARIPKIALLILLVAGCGASPQVADSPDARAEAALQLAHLSVELGSFDRILDRGADLAEQSSLAALELEVARSLTDEERTQVRDIMRRVIGEFLTAELWQEKVALIYAEHFTAGELVDLVAFYDSPLGRKLLDLEGMLTDEVHKSMEDSLDNRMDEFIGRVDEELAVAFEGLDTGEGS